MSLHPSRQWEHTENTHDTTYFSFVHFIKCGLLALEAHNAIGCMGRVGWDRLADQITIWLYKLQQVALAKFPSSSSIHGISVESNSQINRMGGAMSAKSQARAGGKREGLRVDGSVLGLS
jgi:hypothetical protein